LEKIAFDDFNKQPEILMSLSRVSTAGVENSIAKNQKIKAKNLLQKSENLPILEAEVHILPLILKNEDWLIFEEKKPASVETLADYSKKVAKSSQKPDSNLIEYRRIDLERKAYFEPEIDLHIEKLTGDFEKLSPAEIVQIQLRQADLFIQKAWEIGMDRVFLIHGIGQGRLRDMIHARLRKNENIAWFKNEYHRKFGFGATEVVFK
jgi:hypothetical protein